MSRFFPLLFFFLIFTAGCNRRPAAVPRPQAWPRIEIYPESYREVNGLMINDSARIEQGATEGWFDIVYPAYNVRINCTLTHIESSFHLQSVIDNRLERLERNAGGASGEMTELTSAGGIGSLLMVTPGALATPVQFIATDSARYVLSGSAVFASPGVTPDSVAPVVGAIERDIVFMLQNLKQL